AKTVTGPTRTYGPLIRLAGAILSALMVVIVHLAISYIERKRQPGKVKYGTLVIKADTKIILIRGGFSPTMDKNNQSQIVEDIRNQFIEKISDNMNAFGTSTSVGRVLGIIYMNKEPMTLEDRKSTRLNSSHVSISYAVF